MNTDDREAPSKSQELDTSKMNLFEVLFRLAMKSQKKATIFLVNGIKLDGYAGDIDAESVIFQREPKGRNIAVNRAAIASFVPDSEDHPAMNSRYGS